MASAHTIPRPRRAQATAFEVASGGGVFALPKLTVGLFQVGQESHRIALGSDRKKHVPLAAGEGWILPAGSNGICEFDEAHSYLTLELDGALLDDAGCGDAKDFRPLFGKIDPLVAELIRNAASMQDETQSLYRETMDLALATHLVRILQPLPQSAIAISDRRLRRALAYIHDNAAMDISLDTLASEAAMSRHHFARAFSKTVGRSPLQYVISLRMELAKLRLRTGSASVAKIALDVGYEDVSRFNRHFRRHVGVTPAGFRKQ